MPPTVPLHHNSTRAQTTRSVAVTKFLKSFVLILKSTIVSFPPSGLTWKMQNLKSFLLCIFRANWVVIHGVKYNGRTAVVCQHSILPSFLMIEDIVIMANGDVFFICRKMHTLRYNKHLHSYEVALVRNVETTTYDELKDYHPLDIYAIKTDGIARKFVRMH